MLGDIRKSGLIPETTLTEVFRSSGNIVLNAHRINNGEPIEYYDTGDFVFIETKTPQETMREVYRQYISYHEKENVEVQIICPVKKGLIGVFNINHEIREAINPRSVDKAEYKYGDTLSERVTVSCRSLTTTEKPGTYWGNPIFLLHLQGCIMEIWER